MEKNRKKIFSIILGIFSIGILILIGWIIYFLTHQTFEIISTQSPTPIPSVTPLTMEYVGTHLSFTYPSLLEKDTKNYQDDQQLLVSEVVRLRSSRPQMLVTAQALRQEGISSLSEASSVAFRLNHPEHYESQSTTMNEVPAFSFMRQKSDEGDAEASIFFLRGDDVISIVVTSPSQDLCDQTLQDIIRTTRF